MTVNNQQSAITNHQYPALHNAMWPGLVGKGGPGAEPPIDLDTMLNLTAAARANGARFDGVDLFLFEPHVSIDSTDDDLKLLADKIGGKGLVVGSLVAPVWPPTGGGSAMGGNGDRGAFLSQVRKACAIGKKLRISASAVTASYGSIRPLARRSGRRIRPVTRRRLPTRFGRRRILPRTTASGWRPKERSAGAACTA
jgi:hypothetical protein